MTYGEEDRFSVCSEVSSVQDLEDPPPNMLHTLLSEIYTQVMSDTTAAIWGDDTHKDTHILLFLIEGFEADEIVFTTVNSVNMLTSACLRNSKLFSFYINKY